jgi:N-acetylmuramoyl-L-alanine amidase
MIRRSIQWLGLMSAALSMTVGLAFASTPLTRVTVDTAAETTRLQIELAKPTAYRWFTLDSPYRLVVDLQRSSPMPTRGLPMARGAVKAVRQGAQADGSVRLVFELEAGTTVREDTPAAAASPASRLAFAITGSAASASPVASASPAARADVAASSPSSAPLQPVKAARAPPSSGREVIVAIDAGHGGQDPGAIGPAGTYEKHVVLDVSKRLAERINREPGMRAILTRDGDYFLKHRERIRRARAAGAQLFVSVHADAVLDRSVSGSSVYVLSQKGASDEQSRWLADRENAADLIGGVSLDDKDPVIASVLMDLSQTAQIGQSMVAAEQVLRSLRRVNDVRKPQVQQAGFLVLKSPDIPSMLVETAFISNPGDERLLNVPAKRQELAEAIFDGVRQFFRDNPPEGSRFALERAAGRTVVATGGEAASSGQLQ